jgi:alpha-galactosidase
MAQALTQATSDWAEFAKTTEKPITFSICEWGFGHPWNWGAKAGNMWRTTMDIAPRWSSIKHIYKKNIQLYQYAKPAHVNDPDMLEVGNGKLTIEENKSHFTLWCMMAAPLVLGNDLRQLTDGSDESKEILNILTNKSLIMIDQDSLVKQAKRIAKYGSVDILARPLNNGDIAVCLFNKSSLAKTIDFEINSMANDDYINLKQSSNFDIHELWSDTRFNGTKLSASIPKHGVKVYRITSK